ncbi:class I SAM-dependent methyltransferase [Sabulilitoribacter multivorans]|uniref:Class I SAM-dependent methyltransferase n=1 Tax=Flaviramulus multivorans TaxID=1304750 RepID=A0ABS9IID4_9FLAO|nr:class I SAM-dependent methyltransferase [Flaviramulus multivorans]MCF7560328.1 class I SAM-dependent methyltransferase [Flaviramulus multivorans]
MTWEETIIKIRQDEDYSQLVEQAYFDENLKLNVERFSKSEEFEETLKIVKSYAPNAKSILDVGCGNGISAINFALNKYQVTAVEPDSSNTVGAGAIKALKAIYKLDNIEVFEAYAEDLNLKSNTFDVVYVRQAMHHANNLEKFVLECIRVLKPNGLFITVRDHVIYDSNDKEWFLKSHPLHKFYGGENAYKASEYRNAINKAGATILKQYKYYDSIINYFPKSVEEIEMMEKENILKQKKRLKSKVGIISNFPLVWSLYKLIKGYNPLNEKEVPGRMYSYLAKKQ